MKLSREQKIKNIEMFGYENLKVSKSVAVAKLKDVMDCLQVSSLSISVRKMLDLIIANYKETLTDDIVIIKCPVQLKAIAGPALRIPNSEITFIADNVSETQQIWISFDEWDHLGKDFEKVYKKYIDWELISRYK